MIQSVMEAKGMNRMKKSLPILLALALVLTACLSLAEAITVRPLEITQDSYDPDNGEFWFSMDTVGNPGSSLLTMALYLEDRYSLDEIENLRPGDTIEVEGETYTVELLVIHGVYDSDGDGECDRGGITVKNPDQVKDLLDKHKLGISDKELIPSSYEVYTLEAFDGYIAFTVGNDGFCHPLVNDRTFRTLIGTVVIPLPLPEGFVCHIADEFGDKDIVNGTAQDFLDALEYGCNPFCNIARFENGKLMEVRIFPRCRCLGFLGCITEDTMADALIVTLDTQLFQDRFAFGAVKLFLCPVNPAAGDA